MRQIEQEETCARWGTLLVVGDCLAAKPAARTPDNGGQNEQCTFNSLDKFVEAMEENKKLYERLLQVEREKSDLLQKMLDSK